MNATKELDIAGQIERLVSETDSLERRAETLASKAADIYELIQKSDKHEMYLLQQRFEGAEDALMRANRKLMKPVACDCPKCGHAFDVAWGEEKKPAVA